MKRLPLIIFTLLWFCANPEGPETTDNGTKTGNAFILGTVVDEAGSPAAGAVVRLYKTDLIPSFSQADAADYPTDTTDSEGKYGFARVDTGSYNIECEKDNKGAFLKDVAVKEDSTQNTVPPGILKKLGSISGITHMPGQDDTNQVRVTLYMPGTMRITKPNIGGSFRFDQMPEGSYQLIIDPTYGFCGVKVMDVTVAAGTETELDTLLLICDLTNTIPPIARFTLVETTGTVWTEFRADASASWDTLTLLYYRWDNSNDGTWDTDWRTGSGTTFRYNTIGVRQIKLEVRNVNGLTDTMVKTLSVVPGAGPVAKGMSLIPQGSYPVGSDNAEPEEAPAHMVPLSGFYIDQKEVTNEVYRQYMTAAPPMPSGGEDISVIWVTWFDAALYCNQKSKYYGLDTVYTYTGINGSPGDGSELFGVAFLPDKNGFRLPAEAQWEAACRGTTTTIYFFGDDTTGLGLYAWYEQNLGGYATKTGLKEPNQYGLYDILGNAWEWCNDWYDSTYYQTAGTDADPTGPVTGYQKIIRGGGCWSEAYYVRPSCRMPMRPQYRAWDLGLRCVLPAN